MVLSDATLRALLDSGDLVIKDMSKHAIQPASIDFRLGDHFLVVDTHRMTNIDLDKPITYREITAEEIMIPPKSFVLATTIEWLKLPAHIGARVEGRSSIGRMGLFIHNAGWVDPGFEGRITLELFNANDLPIKLHAGRRICQFVFVETDKPVAVPYKGKYSGQEMTVGSRVFRDVELGDPLGSGRS